MGKLRFAVVLLFAVVLSQVADAQVVYEVARRPGDTVVHRPKVGVVMSGGGAKGFAHIRALKAIEDAGIPIDYIAGTSMGSIIGGLYAVGYDPDMMEDLTTHQDWGLIILDKVPRKYMSLDNRLNKRNFFLEFPIKDGKIHLKSSVVDGVYVNMLLTRLTLPAYKQRDFSKLSVPFFCVATDMTTSEPIIWEEGSIARAIRSSMSIPLLFAPVEHGDRLLCDGGLLNNFPVRLMREKGADIVIGIDLEMDYIEKEKLDNSLKILERLIAVVSQHESNKAREECDILIRPDIGKANMLSFNDFSPILKCGDEAGKAHEMELKALADSLQAIEPFEIHRPHVKPIDEIEISKVEVDGVGADDCESIRSYFEVGKLPRIFKIEEIEEIIVKNYSTGYYSDIWYEVKDSPEGNILLVHCKSNSYKTFAFTAHYDNNYRMQVLLDLSMMYVSKNYKRRLIDIDVNIADYPSLRVNYTKFQTNKVRLGMKMSSLYLKMNYYEIGQEISSFWSIQDNRFDLHFQYVPNQKQQLSIGAEVCYANLRDRTFKEGVENIEPHRLYPYLYMRYFFNNEDDPDFLMSGWNVDLIAKLIFNSVEADSENDYGDIGVPYMTLKADINRAFKIGEKHSIRVGAVGVMPLGVDKTPEYFMAAIGGQSRMRYMDNFIPFTGIPFVGDFLDYAAFVKTSWHWYFYKKLYTRVNCDYGYLAYTRDTWFDDDMMDFGVGLTLGYKTPIGPIEIEVSKCNEYEYPVLFVNLGFWF